MAGNLTIPRDESLQMMNRLTDSLPKTSVQRHDIGAIVVGVLPGEGIGNEVVSAALDVLNVLSSVTDRKIEVRTGGMIGSEARRSAGKSLTDETIKFCESVFGESGALFCGPGGARFVYDLRERFDLFCKFTPLAPMSTLRDTGVLRPDQLDKVNIIAVRENVGGAYFGQWGRDNDAQGRPGAYHRFEYRLDQVTRILGVAARLAARRRGKLSVALKREGVPTISELWIEGLEQIRRTNPVDVEILDIDNAVYQLIADPHRFDVIVSSNMFGDILADCGSLLLGSRGMSYSGNFSGDGKAVYQTGHGAAFDIAGTNTANPVGQILSMAMMLRESFAWPEGADVIRAAVTTILAQGYRTRDIAGPDSQIVGTRELGLRICDTLHSLIGKDACAQPLS